jgi:hypothetical protein
MRIGRGRILLRNAEAASNSQMSEPQYIYYIQSLSRVLLRNAHLPNIAECFPKHIGQRICVRVDPGSGCDTAYEGSGRSLPSHGNAGETEPKLVLRALPSSADASGAASKKIRSRSTALDLAQKGSGMALECRRESAISRPQHSSLQSIFTLPTTLPFALYCRQSPSPLIFRFHDFVCALLCA